MALEVTLAETADHQATIMVANQGKAIPAEHLPKIFDRLYRVDASRKDGHNENVGLGLAIAKSIVTMHNGTISVESGEEWTCFTITLPKGRDQRTAGSPVTGVAA